MKQSIPSGEMNLDQTGTDSWEENRTKLLYTAGTLINNRSIFLCRGLENIITINSKHCSPKQGRDENHEKGIKSGSNDIEY